MVTATFTNLAINTSIARDSGVLKRVAGTPLPMMVNLGGRILSAVLIGLLSVVLMLIIGVFVFGLDVPWGGVPLFFLMLMLGATTFSALGLAVAAISPSARAAPAIANFVILPLAFVSGIFFPLDDASGWLQTIAGILPLEPLATAAIDIFDPTTDAGFPWLATVKLLIWCAIGLIVAMRFFSYEPSEGRRSAVSVAD